MRPKPPYGASCRPAKASLLAKPPRNVNLGNDRSAMFNKKAGHPRASPQCDSRWYASQNVLP
jgi:hypothetical protein